MNKCFAAYCLLVLSSLATIPGALAQEGPGRARLEVFTDRTLYISGEEVLISAWVPEGPGPDTTVKELVLYCELITPGGSRVTSTKYPLSDHGGQGCLTIPEETVTGNYYLKSYTRSMRNGPLSAYDYRMLTIINPSRSEVLEGNDVNDAFLPTAGDSAMIPANFMIRMDLAPDVCGTGDSVRLTINGWKGPGYFGKACLTVIPEVAYREPVSIRDIHESAAPAPVYFPESRGISLSGTLVDGVSRIPLVGILVNLSVLGKKDFMANRSDSAGRFFFALPALTGSHDVFLCAEERPGYTTSVLIDNDFCPRPLSLPVARFSLTGQEKEAILNMAINQKISKAFHADSLHDKPSGLAADKPFYGEPSGILMMDNYIELPTLEEYFNELPFGVKVRKEGGQKEFRFLSGHADMTVYDPLVLVDWVAVSDIERVLAMPPREIDRIELVNVPYIKGSVTYGGIISFVSRNDDFAGIDLPSSGTFVNYQFYSECEDGEIDVVSLSAIPDSRNTVYWDPDLDPAPDGYTEIIFLSPATPGKYMVLLRWVDEEGNRHSLARSLSVR